MNIGKEIVQELLESSTPIVALYPGKFKPPHAGHFNVVQQASKIADEVVVIMSNIPKDEFTPEQSMEVWSLYKDLLPSNVEIKVSTKSSPVSEVFDIVKDKSRDFIVLYGKGERSRYAAIDKDREKYSNVQIVDAGTAENFNATDLRAAIRNKDLKDIQTFLPKGIDAKKIFSIYSKDEFKPGPMVHEMAKSDLDSVEKYADKELDPLDIEFSKHFFDRVNDSRNDKEISTAELIGFFKRLARNKNKFVEFLKKYNELVVTDSNTNLNIPFVDQVNQVIAKTVMRKQEFSTSNPTLTLESKILSEGFSRDKAPLIQKLVTFACEHLGIEQPSIKLITSPSYSQEYHSFGGYMPSEQYIKVVVHNRNMADILRTLAHELVHHKQNSNGEELNGEDGSDTENEANATAGVIMRKFGRENPQIFESKLNEAIVGDKIECDNCGWSWDIEDGGDDLFICHKCGHDNIDEYDVENEQDLKEFTSFLKEYNQQLSESKLTEAEYQGRKVQLGKPMQGDIKKFKVYVKNNKGKVVKVNFGFGGSSAKGKRMNIKVNNPKRRAAYRARHNCANPGPRWKANYWSCKKW
jgi:cytidyltransferase-like protein